MMYNTFTEQNPTFVGVSEWALRPLINEQDEDISAKAIQKVREDVSGKQHAGRGHKKKTTYKEVKRGYFLC